MNLPTIIALLKLKVYTNADENDLDRDDFYPKAVDTIRTFFSASETRVIVDVAGRAYREFQEII